jgi:protein-tyrosine phosphatase
MVDSIQARPPFIDIHCHLIPRIDDGPRSWDESLEMARIAAADGIDAIVVTPHQLGNYAHNDGDTIRSRTAELQKCLDEENVPLRVLAGADVRIEPDIVQLIAQGQVLTLGDHRKHVLLELPHELYFPIDGLLKKLNRAGLVGILSHPERNQGILKHPEVVKSLVEQGCLMQLTASSLIGVFGPGCQEFSDWMIRHGLVHFIATDAHGSKTRRPLMSRAFQHVAQLTDYETAIDLCCLHPAAVVEARDVPAGARPVKRSKSYRLVSWLPWRKAS